MSPTRFLSRRSRCRSAASASVLKRSSRIGRAWTVSGSSSPSRWADSGRACCFSSRSRSFTRCARIVARAWRCIRRSISSTSAARTATSVISTSGLATFVQYSAVPMTAGWQMLRRQVRPTVRRLTAVAAAGTGVWLLAAGVPGALRASRADQAGVAFAVASAVAFSFYLLGSARLARDTGARPATAWGLSIGAIPMLVWFPQWTAHPSGDPLVVAGLTGRCQPDHRWPAPVPGSRP
jgi:hypothetical protein